MGTHPTRSLPHCLAWLALAACGCAHHQNQYAYAPPLAPPVYPQPQMPVPVQAAPAAGAIVSPAGNPPPVAGGVMPPVTMTGDPCCPSPEGGAEGVPVVYETAAGQPQPCPPGW